LDNREDRLIVGGRYRIDEVLGEGTDRSVYRVYDFYRRMPLVLKTFSARSRHDPARRRALTEFGRLAGISFPSIVPVIDCGLDPEEGTFFFTCHPVDGEEFIDGVARCSFEAFLDLLAHILRALDFLHRSGVVHGDLKPGNVLIEERDGEILPRIIDFGLARSVEDAEGGASGTLLYMAPEVLNGGSPGVESDLYSLGLMVFQALCGKLPFDDSSPEASIRARLGSELLMPPVPPEGVPGPFFSLLAKLLKRDPGQRFLSAREVLNELSGFRKGGIPLVTKGTLAGRVRSSRPALVEEEAGRILDALGIPDGGGGPVTVYATPGSARLLAEQLCFGAVAEGVHATIIDYGAKVAPLARDVRKGNVTLLLLLFSKRPLPDAETTRVLSEYRARCASGAVRMAVFIPGKPGKEAEPWEAGSAGDSVRIAAGRLTGRETEEYLASLFEWDSVPPSLVHLLCPSEDADFHGLREMLILLVVSGIVDFEMGKYRFHEERLRRAGVDGLEILIGSSLDNLSSDEREFCDQLSLFSGWIRLSLVEACMPGRKVGEIVRSLGERGLLAVQGEESDLRIAFESYALRGVIYGELPAGKRREFHAAAARLLAGVPARSSEEDGEIAIHLARAGDADRAIPEILRVAGERVAAGDLGGAYSLTAEALAMEEFADAPEAFRVLSLRAGVAAYLGLLGKALELFDRALDIAARAGVPSHEQAGIFLEKAKAFVRTGDSDRAIACYDAALGFEMDDGPGRAVRARAKSDRAYALYRMHRLEEALAEMEEALALQSDSDGPVRAVTCNRLGTVLFSLGRFDESESRYRESIRLFEAAGEIHSARGPSYNLGRILKARGCKAGAIRYMERAVELARIKEETYSVCTILTGLAATLLDMGDPGRAREVAVEALGIARELGSKRNIAFLKGTLGEIALLEGDPEMGGEFFDGCENVWNDLGDTLSAAKVSLLRAEMAIRLNLPDEAGECLQRFRDLGGDRLTGGDALNRFRAEAELGLAFGRFDDAFCVAEKGLAAVPELAGSEGEFRLQLARAKALAGLGRGGEALDAIDSLAERLPEGVCVSLEASLQIVRCTALRVLGRPEERLLRETISRISEAGLRDLLAESSLELARTLRAGCGPEPSFQTINDILQVLREAAGTARSVRHDLLAAAIEEEEKGVLDLAPGTGKEPHLVRRFSNMERLQEITRIINSEMDLKKLLSLIVDRALEMTGAIRGFIILVKGGQMNFAAARHITEEDINDPEFEVSHSIAREVALIGGPVLTSNAQDDERFREAVSISELRLLSVLCVPLKRKEAVVGSLYIDNPDRISAFDEYDLKMMTVFANHAGIAIGNADLLEQNKKRQQELTFSKAEIERLNTELKNTVKDQAEELVVVKDSLEARQRQLELKYRYDNIITQSPAMHEIFKVLDRITPTDFPVLILGESGTGKDLVARSLHYNGPRRKENIVSLNCAAVVEPLIESELFGYMKGAFTGAERDKAGLFEQADRGTLFLDEIGDMSLEVQKRLLRVLQSGEFMRVGGKDVVRVNVRILSATNKDIHAMVHEGTFREDLFYRLNVAVVRLPPMRDRKEDIPLLVEHFNTLYSERTNQPKKKYDSLVFDLMKKYPWRGNVRELENVVRNLMFFEGGQGCVSPEAVLKLIELPAEDKEQEQGKTTLRERMEQYERDQIISVLHRCDGNKTKTAKELSISLRGLYKKLTKYGIS
jgi:transcriptional regulator with GAF, ATPase, and Fis domain/tetratricopeptide (TPR) repeat protein/tRNA A-37 threonylcarbamoyl transferase component Bud32